MDPQPDMAHPTSKNPLDLSALDPADPEVAEEVARRMGTQEYSVTAGTSPSDVPAWLEDARQQWRVIWTNCIAVVLFIIFFLCVFLLVPVAPTLGSIISIVTIVVATISLFIPKSLPIPPPASKVRTLLTSEVRYSLMARRNGYVYVVGGTPGSQVFTMRNNPVVARSLLCQRGIDSPISATTVATRFTSGQPCDCEFGTMGATRPTAAAPLTLSRRSKIIVFTEEYVLFRLAKPQPHIVLDSRVKTPVGTDLPFVIDPSLEMSVDEQFDKAFATYCPDKSGRQVRELLSDKVRSALVALGEMYNVEIVGQGLILFRKGGADYTQASSWETVRRVEEIVDGQLRPALGEGGLTDRP